MNINKSDIITTKSIALSDIKDLSQKVREYLSEEFSLVGDGALSADSDLPNCIDFLIHGEASEEDGQENVEMSIELKALIKLLQEFVPPCEITKILHEVTKDKVRTSRWLTTSEIGISDALDEWLNDEECGLVEASYDNCGGLITCRLHLDTLEDAIADRFESYVVEDELLPELIRICDLMRELKLDFIATQ